MALNTGSAMEVAMRSDADKKNVQIGIRFWLDEDGSTIRVSSNARPDFRSKARILIRHCRW